jgi:hypothetical protein
MFPIALEGPVTTAPNLLVPNPLAKTVPLPCCIVQLGQLGQLVATISPTLASPVPFTKTSGEPAVTVPLHANGAPLCMQVPDAVSPTLAFNVILFLFP